ncbi:MFS transporter [Fodinicola feengrottensis]|uniref:MFS transporter n=1 Tax=Fodinicola feengrottensis TaxID=435914 RepID=UPI0031D84E31
MKTKAIVSVAYAFAAIMVGTTLPTPLYPIYQHQLGFGSGLTTVIYAVYAAGVLVPLLLFGRASDVLGRRPVLLAALGVSALSSLIFLTGPSLPVLFLGRVVSGVSAGLVTAAAVATMVDLADPHHRRVVTMAATAVNMLGLGCGPLLSGLLADLVPLPLYLPYAVQFALLVPATVLVWRAAPATPAASGKAFQRPRLAVPPEVRGVFVPAAIAAFAAFAVLGLLTAVEPGLLATTLHQTGHAVAGAVVFSMFAGSALSQLVSSRWRDHLALPAGCLTLVVGLAAIGIALALASLPLLAIGTIVAGAGHGLSFRAAMNAITEYAPADRRAEVVAALNVVAYVGISIPVVLVGLATAVVDLRTAAIAFAVVMSLVALAAMAALLRLNRSGAVVTSAG